MLLFCGFFCKQKTAYEMRISDWSSDVCSSDLTLPEPVDEGDAAIRGLMHDKRFWAIIAARMLSDPVWYFYLFWIPGYLQERAGLSLSELGVVGGLPFIAAVRSEERRVGQECVSTCRSRWSPYH